MTNNITVGARVRITDAHTPIEGFPVGSGESKYVGALGTVRHVVGADYFEVDFDNKDLSSLGSWSRDALDLLHPAPGTEVRVTSKNGDEVYGGHYFEVGEIVRRTTRVVKDSDDAAYEHLDGSDYWFLRPEEFIIVGDEPEAPGRPLIDFSGSSRATARIYAERHVSKVNKPETNALLKAVVAGEKVDAYALNEALLDAMRGAATRAGQSMTRRQHGREIAYLGHIVQAVLENHADNLPVYAEGDRSRAVEAAREGIREAKAEVDRLTEALKAEQGKVAERETQVADLRSERSTLSQAASDERRRLVAEIDDLKAERETLATVLGYALDRVSDRVAQRVLGFWDGLK